MSLYNDKVKDYKESYSKLTPQNLIEIIYFPIFAILFFVFEFKIKSTIANQEFANNIQFAFIPFLIGLIHILACNVLAFLYNLQRIITPFIFPQIVTPKSLKIIGGVIVTASILFGILQYIKRYS